MNKKQIYFILIALCFIIYANSLNNAFVSDDIDSVLRNPLISKPLHAWLLPHDFLNSVDYLIARFNPIVYHLTNIILHSVATILIFLFLQLFFKTEPSLIGASLFAVLPIHAEAVTWISGKPYIITAIFILLGYFLYYYATEYLNPRNLTDDKQRPMLEFHPKQKRINATPFFICIVIFSYYLWRNFSFYFLMPCLLVLSDITFKRWRKNWKWWIVFFLIVIAKLLTARNIVAERVAYVAKEAGSSGSSWTNPLYNMAYSFFAHFGLLVWPFWPNKLTLYHEPPVISIFALRVELVVLFILVPILLLLLFKKAKVLFFAIFIFIIFLAPTYSPIMISWLLAERYVYFSAVTFCIFVAFVYERAQKIKKIPQSTTMILFISIIAAYAARTVARNEDWKTPERFWRQTVLASPNSPRAHNNLADIYGQEGNIEGALREFKRAVELKPDYADAYHNLANTYQIKGNITEAIKYYKLAVTFNPVLFESHFNLGIIYLNNGELNLAIEHLKEATEIRPENKDARNALNFALNKKGRE